MVVLMKEPFKKISKTMDNITYDSALCFSFKSIVIDLSVLSATDDNIVNVSFLVSIDSSPNANASLVKGKMDRFEVNNYML